MELYFLLFFFSFMFSSGIHLQGKNFILNLIEYIKESTLINFSKLFKHVWHFACCSVCYFISKVSTLHNPQFTIQVGNMDCSLHTYSSRAFSLNHFLFTNFDGYHLV